MRNFNSISNFLGANTLQFIGGGNSQNEVRKTEGEQPRNRQRISNLSLTLVSTFVRYAACIALLLCLGVGQMWGDVTVGIVNPMVTTSGGASSDTLKTVTHLTLTKELGKAGTSKLSDSLSLYTSGDKQMYKDATKTAYYSQVCYKWGKSRSSFSPNLYLGYKVRIEDGYKFSLSSLSALMAVGANFTYKVDIVSKTGSVLFTAGPKSITNHNNNTSTNAQIDSVLSSKANLQNLTDSFYVRAYMYVSATAKYFCFPKLTITGTVEAAVSGNTLSFDANGGTGTIADIVGTGSQTLPSSGFTNSGYTLAGWATSYAHADAGTVDYALGGSYTLSADATLYAVWQVETPSISFSDDTDNKVTITCATSDVSIYYTTNGTTPTTGSTLYDGTFTIRSDKTVKAIAVKANYKTSEVASLSCTHHTATRKFKSGERIYFKDDDVIGGVCMKYSGNNLWAVFDGTSTWVEAQKESGSWDAEGAIYYFDVPGVDQEYDFVIFTRNDWGIQTGNETTDVGKNMFVLTSYDNNKTVSGTWSRYVSGAALIGDFNEWNPDEGKFVDGRVILDLDASESYEFKVLCGDGSINTNYWGLTDGSITNTTSSWWLLYSNQNNCTVTTGEAGEYCFHWDNTNHYIGVYYPQARFAAQQYIYFNVEGETGWKSLGNKVMFWTKYYDSGDNNPAEGLSCTSPLETYVYYTQIPNNDYIGRVQLNMYDGSTWKASSLVSYAYSRTSSKQNCMIEEEGKESSTSEDWTPQWTTYCPPMSAASLSDNSTMVIAGTSGTGTSENPFLVPTAGTIKVSASATSAVADPNMTKMFDFKVGGSSAQDGTGTTFSKESLSNNTTYTITVDAYNTYNSTNGTKSTPDALYYKALDTYNIAYKKGTNGTGDNVTDLKLYGIAKTLRGEYFTRTGYTQTSWATTDGGSTAYNLSASYTSNAAVDLYPVWTAKTTTVTIDANTSYHGSTAPSSFTATYDSELPEFTAATGETGYHLTGYFTDATGGTKVIDADGTFSANSGIWNRTDGATLTLYAQYEINTYTVTFASNNDSYGTVDVSEITGVTHGSEVDIEDNVLTLKETDVTATATTSTAAYTYAFSSWSVSDGDAITSAQTITATFTRTANSYTLAWDKNGGSTLTGDYTSGSTAYETTLTPPDDPTRDGYTFTGWNSADDGSGDDYTGTMPAEDVTYYAQWEEIDYCYEFAPTLTSGNLSQYDVAVTSSGGILEYTPGGSGSPTLSYSKFGDNNGLLFGGSSSSIVTIALKNNIQEGTIITAEIIASSNKSDRTLYLRTASSDTNLDTWTIDASSGTANDVETFTYTVPAKGALIGTNKFRIVRKNNAAIKSLKVSNCGSAATTYNVSHSLTNVSFSSGIDAGTGAALAGGNYTAIFEADDCYTLPSTITVTIGGDTKTVNTDYKWDSSTGKLAIKGASVTGAIVVTITGVDNHIDPELAYETTAVSKKDDDDAFTNALTNTYGVTVSYESSDKDVATVDSDGEVTIVGAGTCTITASADAQDCYTADDASYTLTVTSCTTPTASWSTTPANGIVGGSMTAAVTTNYSDGLVYSVTDATPSGCVTINSSGVISYVKPGTATVKATVTGDGTTYCEGPAEVSQAIIVHNAQVENGTYAYYYSDASHFDGTNTYKNPEGNTPGGSDGDNTALSSSWTIRNSSFMDGLTSVIATNARYDKKNNHINAYIKLRQTDGGKIVFTIAEGYEATIKIKMGGYSGKNENLTMKLDDSGDNISYTGSMAGKAEVEDSFAELTYADLAAGAYILKPTSGSLYISQIDIETTLVGYAITNGSPSGGTIAITDGSSPITTAAEGGTVYITATPSTGYKFDEWSIYKTGDESTTVSPAAATASTTFTMPAYGVTVSASFSLIDYSITYNTNDGTINDGEVTSYNYGTGATLPTDVTRDGYRFMGWYDNSSCTGDPVETISTSATGDKEYWAKWAQLYTIATGTHANGAIAITNSSSEVITEAIQGETVSIAATAGIHYSFDEWSIYKTGDESTTVSPAAAMASTTFTMPAYGVTVNATFAKENLTLSYDDGDATSGSAPTNPVAGDYAYGTVITVPDNNTLAKDEDAFVGWLYNNKTLYVAGQKFTMTEDVELTAVWNTACSGGGVLFEQDFGDATGVAYAGSTARAYTKASGLDNCVGDDDNLFTSLTVTSQSATGIAVNSKTGFVSTDASGVFQAKKGGNSAYWSITRTNDFATTAPTAISVAMDIWFHNTNSGSNYIGVDFAVGDDFADGLNSSSSQTSTNVHSGFCITDESSAQFAVWNSASTKIYNTAITQSTWLSVVWIINNTGSTLTYDDPDGSGTSTVNNDCFDIWLKTQAQDISYYTRVVAGQAAITGSKDLQNIHIGGHGAKQHEFQLDNVVVTNLTPGASSSGCKFDVTFDNMDGFAGSAVTTLPSGIEGVPANRKIAKPADPITTGNYVFGGWFTDDACTEAWDFASDKVTEDVTLYAKWYDADYTITWKANGETYATTKACDAVTTIVLPTAPADNLLNGCANSFRGWSATNLYGEANDDQPADLFIDAAGAPTINADKTFYAVFGTATDAAYLGTVLWSEDWTDAANNSTPASLTAGGYAYPGSVISYSYTDGTGDNKATTKVATDNNAGGVVPELMVGYGTTTAGAFTITGLPNKGAKELTLIYKRNHSTTSALNPSVRGEGYSISKVSGTGADTYVYTITCGTASTFDLTLTGSTTKNNNVRVDDIILKVKTDGATDYRCICPSLTVTPDLITEGAPIFITSAASKTVRSQDRLHIVGSGLSKNTAVTLSNPDSKFVLKTEANGDIMTDAETGAIDTYGYIFYTPASGDTSDGLDNNANFTVSVTGNGAIDVVVDQALIGRHLPADFVIAAKNTTTNKWYALPADMSSESNPTPVEIAVDDIDNPTVAYTATTNIYNLYGQNSGAGYLEEAGQYIKLGMKNNGNYPLYGYSGTKTTIKGNSGATVTNNIGADHWWLLTQTNTSANVSNPKDARYTIANASNEKTLSAWFTAAGGPKWGLYAAGNGEHTLRILPVQSGVGFAEAEIVAWGKNSAIVEVDNSTMIAEYVKAKLPEDVESEKITLTQTRTSVKGTGTRYNYTVNFGEGVDFSANDGKMLTLEWYDILNNLKAISNIMVPCIVADDITINKSNYSNKSDWNKEVHVLPGTTVTVDASAYSSSNVTIKELVIYPGAKVVAAKGTLIVPTLVLRNGWNRLTAETEYNVAQMYITPTTGSLQATAAYADWYIDYDQYYPIAVPWKVATANIAYRNTSGEASEGVIVRYYDGERRAKGGAGNTNWKQYTWGYDMPTNLEPGIGYAITARRPAGKAFSIVRLPLTIPSTAWTTEGEQGEVSDTHKDQVAVTAWVKDEGETPEYAKGWNFVANPYMSVYEGVISFTPDDEPEGDYEDEITYVNIPDVNFKEFEQVAAETAELKPGCGFLIQTEYNGTITFGTENRKASAPSYRTSTPRMPKQKAYILLSGEEAVDQMGLIIADRYTENYEVNADLEKLLSDGNTLRTYMQYGNLNMAYVAINSMLAQELIPVSVRIPAAGEYTYSLHYASRVSELEGIYLVDYMTNKVTNLMESDYTFTSEAGTITDRFAINAIEGQHETPTDIDVVQGGGDIQADHPIKFIYQEKVYIYHKGVIYDAMGKKVAERRAAL